MADPQSAVVYALRHLPSGLVYVGSTRDEARRRRVWSARLELLELGSRPDRVSEHFAKLARGVPASGWQFVVVERLSADASEAELREAEFAATRCFYRLDAERCLNVRRGVDGWFSGRRDVYFRRRFGVDRSAGFSV